MELRSDRITFVGYFLVLAMADAEGSHLGGGSGGREAPADSAQACVTPKESKGLSVDTDGPGPAEDKKTHQQTQSYSHTFGGPVSAKQILGAVNLDQSNGLTGGDIICYQVKNTGATACGVVFDNGYTAGKGVGRKKNGEAKPEEATVPVHAMLGAKGANGNSSPLAEQAITAQGIKLSGADREKIIAAVKIARETGSYKAVNDEIQRTAQQYHCQVTPQVAASGGAGSNI